jgi:hypothetical protein
MEILATFPAVPVDTVSVLVEPSAPCPAHPVVEHDPGRRRCRAVVRPRQAGVRVPPRSVTVLTIVALATWAAVWWIERSRPGDRGAAVAHAGASAGTELVR